MEGDSGGGLSVFREQLVAAGVCAGLYAAGLAVAALRWWRPDAGAEEERAGVPLAAAALAAAALLAWALRGLLGDEAVPALALVEAWGSGWAAALLLLAAYFHAEAVGCLGATGPRARAAESAGLAAGALLLARAGAWAAAQLGLAQGGVAGQLAAAWCAGAAARRLSSAGRWRAAAGAAAAAAAALLWPPLWHLLAAGVAVAGTGRGEEKRAGGVPLLCLRAGRAMLVACAGHAGCGGGHWLSAASAVLALSALWHSFIT